MSTSSSQTARHGDTTMFAQEKDELELFETVKPFLGRAFRLNHDINNPLAGILGYGEFLLEERETLSVEHQEYLDKIMESAERIKVIIDEFSEMKMQLAKKVDVVVLQNEWEKKNSL